MFAMYKCRQYTKFGNKTGTNIEWNGTLHANKYLDFFLLVCNKNTCILNMHFHYIF